MMYGWDAMGGWGWGLMALQAVALWALVVVVGVALWRLAVGPAAPGARDRRRTPEDVLAERFARGEIDEDEYRRRAALLESRTVQGS
jgi:putative membrane protein